MTTVVEEDPSRPPWPSCPSHGWASGVDALWGLPNGSPLGLQPLKLNSSVAAATCTFETDVDFDNGSIGPLPSPSAKNAQECCDLCTNYAGGACVAATFSGGTCWMKNLAQSKLPEKISNVVGVWTAGHGPAPTPGPAPSPPPPSPPGALACASLEYETHGVSQSFNHDTCIPLSIHASTLTPVPHPTPFSPHPSLSLPSSPHSTINMV